MTSSGSDSGRAAPLGAFVFVASVALALPDLGRHMYWPNEADMVLSAAGSLADVFDLKWKNQSSGWPLLLHFWMKLGGTGEAWTRLLTVLLGSLGAVWTFRFGELLAGRRAGLVSAAVFALVPTAHWHLREARMYGFLAALAVGAFYFAVSWERRGRRRDLPALVAVLLAAAYIHFFGLAIAVAVFGSLGVGALLRPDGPRGPRLRAIGAATGATALGLLPQALRLRAGVDYAGGPNSNGLTGDLAEGMAEIGQQLWLSRLPPSQTPADVSTALLIAGLAVLGIGATQLPRPPGRGDHQDADAAPRREPGVPRWWTGASLVLFVVGAIFGFIAAADSHDIRGRYVSFVAGPLAVGIALALTTPRKRLWLLVYPAAAFLLWASWSSIEFQHTYRRGNLDALVARLDAEAAPTDTIIPEPGILGGVVELKTGRRLLRTRQADRAMRSKHPPSDTTWVVHVHGRAGRPKVPFLLQEYRLLEQRTSPGATLFRWSRSAREAAREADLEHLLQRAKAATRSGATTLALTGAWRGSKTGRAALTRRLTAAVDLVVSTGTRRGSGAPVVNLAPGRQQVLARGTGWSLGASDPLRVGSFPRPWSPPGTPMPARAAWRAADAEEGTVGAGGSLDANSPGPEARPIVLATLDLRGWADEAMPPTAERRLRRLAQRGVLVLRLIPPRAPDHTRAVARARAAIASGASVVTVDGLGGEWLTRVRGGVIVPSLDYFSSPAKHQQSGRVALIALDAEGRARVDMMPTSTSIEGAPRAGGLGLHHLPARRARRRPREAMSIPYDAGQEGQGRSLLDLYPRQASAVSTRPRGAQRRCTPLGGSTELYRAEWGPEGVGELRDRMDCGDDPFDEAWNVVARARHRIGGEARECIWLHPQGPQPMTLRFDDVDLGGRLQGHMGITDAGMKKARGTVDFEVRVDGRRVYRGDVGAEPGWLPWAADTRRFTEGKHNVEFIVTATQRRWRHFCFDAEVGDGA